MNTFISVALILSTSVAFSIDKDTKPQWKIGCESMMKEFFKVNRERTKSAAFYDLDGDNYKKRSEQKCEQVKSRLIKIHFWPTAHDTKDEGCISGAQYMLDSAKVEDSGGRKKMFKDHCSWVQPTESAVLLLETKEPPSN